MRKISCILFLFCIFSVFSSCASHLNANSQKNENEYFGAVPNAQVAESIADKVLVEKYGEQVLKVNKPYRIELRDDVWYVQGIYKVEGPGVFVAGNIPYLEIRKSDGKILYMSYEP